MIIVGGKTERGSVIHVILGPESELAIDVRGNQELDVTPLIAAIIEAGASSTISVSVTRTRNERNTIATLNASGISHTTTFDSEQPAEQEDHPTQVAGRKQVKQPAKPRAAVQTDKPVVHKCAYCGGTTELLDIPGFKICESCAIIELSRNRARDVAVAVEAAQSSGLASASTQQG